MTRVNRQPATTNIPDALDNFQCRTAIDAARRAGAAAMAHYGTAIATMKPGDTPVTEADHAANDIIVDAIAAAFPHDAILSEESTDSAARLDAERVWIIDPLDGTKEFLAQNGDFAVMVALVERGIPIVGVIYRPVSDSLFAAASGAGSWVERNGDWTRLHCREVDTANIRLVGSRSHPVPMVERIRAELGITDVMPSGSVGVKCSYIAEGIRDLYMHPVAFLGEWDTCAPEIILREAGGHVCDCRGAPLRYNKPIPSQPDGILATGRLPDRSLIERIAAIYEGGEPAG